MAPTPSNAFLHAQLMYKNRLQEYTQKLALSLPVYNTTSEGFSHAPLFRSTVFVDGVEYRSNSTFRTRKEAEQDVARIAFECISKKIKSEGCPTIFKNLAVAYKSILLEYAMKVNLDPPAYTMTSPPGSSAVFVSSIKLNGKTYTGEVAGSRKMAEQLAARAAIKSLLESDCGILSLIIKSKEKRYSSFSISEYSSIAEGILRPAARQGIVNQESVAYKPGWETNSASYRGVNPSPSVQPARTNNTSATKTLNIALGAKCKHESNNLEQKKHMFSGR